MSDQIIATIGIVLVAIITVMGSVLLALINKTKSNTKAILYQTVNDHGNMPNKVPNLRDNIDVNHEILVGMLRMQNQDVGKLFSRVEDLTVIVYETKAEVKELKKIDKDEVITNET